MNEKRSKALTFTMAGHAHLDPVWLWDWREGYETIKATFRSALDRMAENPDLVFVHSSAAHYHWMEEHPELLEGIRAAVARGQWEPVGGWWVEPDANIPSGESLARQGLYGQRYFEQATGRRARVAFLPDTFGHPPTLPQIIKLSGMDSFVFWRPSELDLPSNLFWWEGPDGTRMLSARIETYNCKPNTVVESMEKNIEWRPADQPEWITVYGVGNHGGGPTKKLIASVRELNDSPEWPTLKFGDLASFFDRAETREHPLYAGPLQYIFRGCYSSYAPIKKANRVAEQTLAGAEKWSTFATRYGRAYPGADLTVAWRHLLFNQFHDVICGTSIKSAYVEADRQMGEAIALGDRLRYGAIQRIAQLVNTQREGHPAEEVMRRPRTGPGNFVADLGDGVPVIVFNPSPWPRHEVIDVELNDWGPADMRVLDAENRPVYSQFVMPEAARSGGRKRICFPVTVPPMGYRMYRLIDEPPVPAPADAPPLAGSATELENTWWRLKLDPQTGALVSLFDKQQGVEVLAGPAAQVLAVEDEGNPWGSGIDAWRNVVGTFGEAKLTLLENGPVRSTVAITTRFGRSVARQEITIYRDTPAIHGKLQVNMQEHSTMLKLAFPTKLQHGEATYSQPFGHVVRPATGEEEPIQQWLDLTGALPDAKVYGVALLNDSKYGADVKDGELRLTMLRTPAFASAEVSPTAAPDGPAAEQTEFKGFKDDTVTEEDPAAGRFYQDQGWTEARWALLPHSGAWQAAGVVQAAQDFNDPLLFVREYVHTGTLPPQQSFLTVIPPDQVVITACKQAEEGDDLVVRLYEPHGQQARVEIDLPLGGARFTAEAGPHQIKTYRISRAGAVREVNFLEE
jgi:alpha-mannosidase